MLATQTTASIAGLRCITCCSHALAFTLEAVRCTACGQEYPVVGGVPVMFESVSIEEAGGPSDETAQQVLEAFELAADPLSMLRMRTMMRRNVRFGSSLIQVESQQFLDRVRNSGHDAVASSAPAVGRGEARDLAVVPRTRWVKSYMPRRMQAGVRFLANMRLENLGTATLHASGPGMVKVAVGWTLRDGSPVAAPDERTPLPIDVPVGQALTVAVMVTPPARPGAYLLTLRLVQEQVRWLDDDALTIAVTVEDWAIDPSPPGWVVLPDRPADYDTDHAKGRDILAGWLKAHAPPQPRVLEVGGNAVPMLAKLEGDFGPNLVNVDVDLLGLQVGRMAARAAGFPISQLCADAFDLPFAAGYFDAIVIFASLHHFPDPAALLEHLQRKLRPGGFIGVLCEPVGHIWPGAVEPAYLAELAKGVNEQSFSLREYEQMFARAELVAKDVLVDWNSLKARLVHAPAGARP